MSSLFQAAQMVERKKNKAVLSSEPARSRLSFPFPRDSSPVSPPPPAIILPFHHRRAWSRLLMRN